MEPEVDMYIEHLVNIFHQIKRVLRKDGTVWLNLASSFASSYSESKRYILRSDLTEKEYAKVFKVLSEMWKENESPKSAVSGMFSGKMAQAKQLFSERMPEMLQGIYDSQNSHREGSREILQSKLCKIWKPETKENIFDSILSKLSENFQQIQMRDTEKQGQKSFLQSTLLVPIQSEKQSSSLGRWPARKDESRGIEVEKNRIKKRQGILSNLSQSKKARSSSHSSVRNVQSGSLEDRKWCDGLPHLSRQSKEQGNRTFGDTSIYGFGTHCGLALNKLAIPVNILQFFQPEYIIKPKDDCSIPERVLLALVADGWYNRGPIIWSKKNPMPESVIDRPTRAHEYVFLFAHPESGGRYFYDAEAIRETNKDTYFGKRGAVLHRNKIQSAMSDNVSTKEDVIKYSTEGRNKRSVWEIPTQSYPGAHFATFSTELILPMIRAGTSAKGACRSCGVPWTRKMEIGGGTTGKNWHNHDNDKFQGMSQRKDNLMKEGRDGSYYRKTIGWEKTCQCETDEIEPCIVLDPFMGSGTTGLVAHQEGRGFIGIEIKQEYIKMAEKRVGKLEPSLFVI